MIIIFKVKLIYKAKIKSFIDVEDEK